MSTREGESWDYLRSLPIALSNLTVVFVQLLSCVRLFVIQWTTACQASLSFTITWSLLKLMSIVSVMPSNHLIFCHPFSSRLQYFPASVSFQVSQFFASGGQSIGVSASASDLPMNIQDWFPLGLTGLILQSKELLSFLQHYSSKASIPRHSAFFEQLSHPYMTTGKNHSLD